MYLIFFKLMLCLISSTSTLTLRYLKRSNTSELMVPIVEEWGVWTDFVVCKKTFSPVTFSDGEANQQEIKYWLFKDRNPYNAISFSESNINELDMNMNLPTKIFLHGWTTSPETSPWYDLLKHAYFKKGPYNIIYVDWNIPGNKSYEISAANIKPVGKIIADLLVEMNIPPSNIHLIGHSLGAQLASYIGKSFHQATSSKLARITGLDPAGPKFEHVNMTLDLRLSPEDAEFVDVVHTDSGCSGYASPCGHVDFYPNYGYNQPGCRIRQLDDNCSHARSTLYFAASVNVTDNNAIEAKVIGKLRRTKIQILEDGKITVFGENVPLSTRGVFYVETKADEPYFK